MAVPDVVEVNDVGDVIEDEWCGLGPNLAPQPPTYMEWGDSVHFFFYLFPGHFAPIDLVYRPVLSMETGQPLASERLQLKLEPWLSPVIQLQSSRRVEGKVYEGRIYLGMEREEPRYCDMRKHYDRLARRIRKWNRTEPYRLYVGPQTAQLQREGHIRLILIVGEREVGLEE